MHHQQVKKIFRLNMHLLRQKLRMLLRACKRQQKKASIVHSKLVKSINLAKALKRDKQVKDNSKKNKPVTDSDKLIEKAKKLK